MRHVPGSLAGPRVRLVDYGIRGMHLAYDLLDGVDALVLVDALPSGGSPGTLHVFEADHEALSATAAVDAHAMDPGAVFASLNALGGTPPYTVVIGCEVGDVGEGIGLSDAVAAAVPEAVRAVEDVVSRLLTTSPVGGAG
jgi:hydrogenase maturation protease